MAVGGQDPPPSFELPTSDATPWYKRGWVRTVAILVVVGLGVVSRSGVFAKSPGEQFLADMETNFKASGVSDESYECVVEEMEAGGYLNLLDDTTATEISQLEEFQLTTGIGSAPPAVQQALQGFVDSVFASGCLSPREMELFVTTPLSGGAPVGLPMAFGDDPSFDRLWSECEAGDLVGCDILYRSSPIGSDYEDFGATCGDRNPPVGLQDYCITFHDAVDLDALQTTCATGDFGSCDLLFAVSPVGSDYEQFGNTCGGRDPAGQLNICTLNHGLGTRQQP